MNITDSVLTSIKKLLGIAEEYEHSGSYEVTPKAHQTQTLDTSGKVLSDDLVIHEVPYYQTSNSSGGVTSYIAKEGDSK